MDAKRLAEIAVLPDRRDNATHDEPIENYEVGKLMAGAIRELLDWTHDLECRVEILKDQADAKNDLRRELAALELQYNELVTSLKPYHLWPTRARVKGHEDCGTCSVLEKQGYGERPERHYEASIKIDDPCVCKVGRPQKITLLDGAVGMASWCAVCGGTIKREGQSGT